MPQAAKARVFMSGRSQHVTIPAEYRFSGDEVFVRRDPGERRPDPLAIRRAVGRSSSPRSTRTRSPTTSWPTEHRASRRPVRSYEPALHARHQHGQLSAEGKSPGVREQNAVPEAWRIWPRSRR